MFVSHKRDTNAIVENWLLTYLTRKVAHMFDCQWYLGKKKTDEKSNVLKWVKRNINDVAPVKSKEDTTSAIKEI